MDAFMARHLAKHMDNSTFTILHFYSGLTFCLQLQQLIRSPEVQFKSTSNLKFNHQQSCSMLHENIFIGDI